MINVCIYYAFQYFVNYKLSENYTSPNTNSVQYAAYFLQYVGFFAAQIPNVAFNCINIFLDIG